MSSQSYCSHNDTSAWESSYWKYVISLPIMIILQSMLLINSCLNCKKLANIPKRISISVFLIQIIGLLWFIHDVGKNITFPQFPSLIFNDHTLCFITGYFDKLFPFMFAGTLVLQLLLRLHITFRKSSYALTSCEMITLFSFFVFPFNIFLILWIIFLDQPCYKLWTPSDYDETFYLCDAAWEYNKIATYTAYIGISWVVVGNICFGLLFSWKIHKVIQGLMALNVKNRENAIEKLMIKNTILTVSIAISTFINYMIYFIDDTLDVFVYLDVFLKSLFVSLMFKHNDRVYYKYICRICNDYTVKKYKELELSSYVSQTTHSEIASQELNI